MISNGTIDGTVISVEKRFTENNFTILKFGIKHEETTINCLLTGKRAESLNIKEGDLAVVSGNLKFIDKTPTMNLKDCRTFSLKTDKVDEIQGDELIGEDEIPF